MNGYLIMPRSHIQGSPHRLYYGLNLTDDLAFPESDTDALFAHD